MKLLLLGLSVFAAFPTTSNYQINSYSFGSGGTANSSTATYSLEGSSGDLNGAVGSTSSYKIKPEFIETQQANVPTIASLHNGTGTYYNKLHFVLNEQGNPNDAQYAISISTDNFVSDIRYVKSDLTVGPTLSLGDYKTYSGWGSASGSQIIGLASGTTYAVRAKATQGKFTESTFGPSLSATTATPSITFNVQTSAQASPPFSINFGALAAGSITNSPQTINLGLDTNAAQGAHIYITGINNGLKSASSNYTIAAVTNNLSGLSEGYGARSSSVSQTTGGPLTAVSPFDGAGENVGVIDVTTRSIYSSAGPLGSGNASVLLKAKSSTSSRAATDYNDTITFVAAGSF